MSSAAMLPSRHHQLLRLLNIQPQRSLQTPVFVGLEQTAVPALRNQELDLIRRMNVSMGLAQVHPSSRRKSTPVPLNHLMNGRYIQREGTIGTSV